MKIYYVLLSLFVFNSIQSQEIQTNIYNHTNKLLRLNITDFDDTKNVNFTLNPNQEKTINLNLGDGLTIPLNKKWYVGLNKEKQDGMIEVALMNDVGGQGGYVQAHGMIGNNILNLHIYNNKVAFSPKKNTHKKIGN